MKCRYKYKMKSLLRLGESFPIDFMSFIFAFCKNDSGFVDEVSITVDVPDTNQWPKFVSRLEGPIKADLIVTHPKGEEVEHIIRFLESALGFYGVETIDIEDPILEWIPDTEEEKKILSVHSFSSSREPRDPGTLPEAKFGLVAQALYAYEDAWNIEPQLNFARRGLIAVREERFIEAIYNFYFYLESTFANGQSRNDRVKAELTKSKELMTAVAEARDRFDLSKHFQRNLIYRRFNSIYQSKNEVQILHTFVDLRGFLHHHSAKRKDIWHPSDKWTYAADAFLLQDTVVGLAHSSLLKYAYSEKNTERFRKAIQRAALKETG